MYTDADAKEYTDAITTRDPSGLLQIFGMGSPEETVRALVDAPFILHAASAVDIGMGTGQLAYVLKQMYPSMDVAGINLFPSQPRIDEARDGVGVYIMDVMDPLDTSMPGAPKAHLGFLCYTLGHLRLCDHLLEFLGRTVDRELVIWDITRRHPSVRGVPSFLGDYQLHQTHEVVEWLSPVFDTLYCKYYPAEARLTETFKMVTTKEQQEETLRDLAPYVLRMRRK